MKIFYSQSGNTFYGTYKRKLLLTLTCMADINYIILYDSYNIGNL